MTNTQDVKGAKPKIVRACTVPQSLGFVSGMLPELAQRYQVVLLSSPGPEWDKLEASASLFSGIQIPMERHIAPWRDLVALARLVRAFRRERPAMVHSMTPKAGLLCMAAAWLVRVPVRVHTFTGLVFPTSAGLKRKVLMATDWLTCACTTHVIPEGQGVRRDLLDNGITRKDIRVLGHGNCRGIDLSRFDPALPDVQAEAAKIRRPGVFTFIAIGRLVGDKGINELVEAFCQVHQQLPHARLLLVGRYEDALDPLRLHTRHAIDSHPAIEAVGAQADVRPWLAAADCHVLASYREGFPNVVIEAGAMGLPQVVTDINGANEIIADGCNGTIVAPRDADALAAAMLRMATDRPWREALAANARPMIASRFDHRYVRQCLLDFYDKIMPTR